MSSRTKRVGSIGEQAIITELLQYPDIIVSKPVTDNEPYDIVMDYKGTLYRVQVKTTEFIKDDVMRFSTSITNPFKLTSKKYTDKDIDMFMLYCLENKYCGLLLMSEYTARETVLRISSPARNCKNIKYAEDYELNKRLSELFNKNRISKIGFDNKNNVKHITNDVMAYLKEHTYKETEKHFDISHNKIIECRKYYKEINQDKEKRICQYCSNEFIAKTLTQKYCSHQCSEASQRKVKRPSYEQLLTDIKELNHNICAIGRKYGVTDNAIRKWIKAYKKIQLKSLS